MAKIQTRCTHCGQGLTLKKPELVGKQVRCPSCRKSFVVRPIKSAGSSPKRSKKPAPTDDDILDADIVEADEVETTSAGDDDWLDALDSLPPKPVPGASTGASAAEAPRVSKSSRKKKTTAKKPKKRSSLRDADGEFPFWLHRVLMVVCGVGAGIIATAIWAGIVSKTGGASRFMAIVAGIFVGTAVRLGASKWDFGWGPAITASVIAFVTIFAGKIAGYKLLNHQEAVSMEEHNTAYVAMLRHEDYPISQLALEMEMEQAEATGSFEMPSQEWEWDAEERFLNSDGSPNWSEVYSPEHFPDRHGRFWETAQQRWQGMIDAEKKEIRKEIDQEIAFFESAERDEYEESYGDFDTNIYGTKVLTPWDFIFSIFAIAAAFRIAAGMTDDEDTSGL